jgi:hypothetical protein
MLEAMAIPINPPNAAAYRDGERWADDLHAVIEAASLRLPVPVGWSLGGLIIGPLLGQVRCRRRRRRESRQCRYQVVSRFAHTIGEGICRPAGST